MIHVVTSVKCSEEKKYIFSVIFSDILKCDYSVEFIETDKTKLLFNNSVLECPDNFFHTIDFNWASWPDICFQKAKVFDVSETSLSRNLPVWIGQPYCTREAEVIYCGIDIFATVFVFLTRYEELSIQQTDEHQRCKATSVTVGRDYIHRPLVDEYIELLEYFLSEMGWINILKNQDVIKNITCDVDRPFMYHPFTWKKAILRAGADVVLRRSLLQLHETINQKKRAILYGKQGDPFYTFNYIMDCMERENTTGTFYFLVSNTGHPLDGTYDVTEPDISLLIQNILQRGHVIGLHPSYNSFKSKSILSSELAHLEKVIYSINGRPVKHVRQHYLRWQADITPGIQAESGLEFDSSIAFAEVSGFRSGTCRVYTMYDLKNRKKLSIKQQPLIVMDCSLIDPIYMNLDHSSAYYYVKSLFEYTKKYCGTFSLLWHNSYFNCDKDKELYESLLEL